MTEKASSLAARLAATATGSRPAAAPTAPLETEPTSPSRELLASQVQRFTMNLPKAQHRFVRQFALAADTDVATIVRLLLARIESDPVFAEEVREMLANNQ